MKVTAYVHLAHVLYGMVAAWKTQDRELADARAGLLPEERHNEESENLSIERKRAAQVRQAVWQVIGQDEQNARLTDALRGCLACLVDWVEIAESHDQRKRDWDAIRKAEALLKGDK